MPAMSAKPLGIYPHTYVSTWSVIGTLTFSDIYIILHNVALFVLMSNNTIKSTKLNIKCVTKCCCNACYVGETSRHLSTYVREHLVSDRNSHIFRHLHNSPQCRTLCSDECFNILDHASTNFQLKIKEVNHIQWEKPTLNHQLYHHVNLKLSL